MVMKSKVINYAIKILLIVTGVIAACCAVLQMANTGALYLVLFTIICIFIIKLPELSPKRYIPILLCFFILKVIFVLNMNTKPVSDFALIYNAAQSVAGGDYSALHSSTYFRVWGYYTGFVLFEAFWVKLGAGVTTFKLINCVVLTITNVLVYLIARRISSEKNAQIIGLLYAMYPATYIYAPVLTSQHLANMFLFLGIYVWVSHQNVKAAIVSGFILALGNAIRPIGIIVICALGFACVLTMVNEKEIKSRVWHLIAVLGTYFVIGYLLSAIIIVLDINPSGLDNKCPQWKFIEGLNLDTGGGYSDTDADYVFGGEYEEISNRADELLAERISELSFERFIDLLETKVEYMWGSQESVGWTFMWEVSELDMKIIGTTSAPQLLTDFASGLYCMIFALAAVALFQNVRKSVVPEALLLVSLVFLLYFGAHLLIEVQIRYRDFGVLCIFLIASNVRIPRKTSLEATE